MYRVTNNFKKFLIPVTLTLLLPIGLSHSATITPEQIKDFTSKTYLEDVTTDVLEIPLDITLQIKNFIRQIYIEGVPYEDAVQLQADIALPVIEEMLNDPREEDYWANAVVTAGMIGSDQSARILTNFITRREANDKLTRAQTVAKTSAVMSLGYIVNRTKDSTVLDFLMKSADPKVWNERNLSWIGEFHSDSIERDKQLVTMAVLGMGLSGNADAANFLESLKEVPGIDHVAVEALKANQAISSSGMLNYYLESKPRDIWDESQLDIKFRPKFEIPNQSIVVGELIKQASPGEALREPQVGEVILPAETGEIIMPAIKLEHISIK